MVVVDTAGGGARLGLGSRATRASSRRRSFGGVSVARRSPSRAFLDCEWRRRRREALHATHGWNDAASSLVYQVGLVSGSTKRARGTGGAGGDRGANGTVVVEETRHFGQKMRRARSTAHGWRGSLMMTTEMMTITTATTRRAVAASEQAVGDGGDGKDDSPTAACSDRRPGSSLTAEFDVIVALADALDAATFDLQDLAHELHTSGLTTAGKPWPSPSSPSVPSANLTDPSPTALALRYSTPTGKGTGAAGSSAETPVRMTPRTPICCTRTALTVEVLCQATSPRRDNAAAALSGEDSRRQRRRNQGES